MIQSHQGSRLYDYVRVKDVDFNKVFKLELMMKYISVISSDNTILSIIQQKGVEKERSFFPNLLCWIFPFFL